MTSPTRLLLSLSLTAAILIAWGMRFLNEDLFVALCSGRDTWNGLLATPDRWSFTTGGAVWVDQSWLSHLFYFLSHSALSDLGPVLIKGLLLVGVCLIFYFRCRRLDASPEISLSATILGTLSLAPFLQIRAENFGLIYFAMLSSLLAAPSAWVRWRQIGCVVILAIWSNSHGSFILGYVLIGLRFSLDLLLTLKRAGIPGLDLLSGLGDRRSGGRPPGQPGRGGMVKQREGRSASKTDPIGWLITLAIAFLGMAFLNPYGPSNLLMPFRQISASSVTAQSTDWVPLVQLESVFSQGFLQPLDVLPFVGALLLIAVLSLATLLVGGIEATCSAVFRERPRADVVMEVLMPLVLVILALRFRRIILFAGLSIVPLLALTMQAAAQIFRERFSTYVQRNQGPKWKGISTIAALALLAFLCFQFYSKTALAYLPDNPMRYDRPIVAQWMSFDSYNTDVVDFMTRNHIKGRVFTSWTISDFLLFHVPDIQVFIDCRDQSAYSDDLIGTYFRMLNSGPKEIPGALGVLDMYRVSYVVLATNPRAFRLATLLMQTRKWGCIYKDEEVFVLARADSARYGPAIRSGDLDGVRYGSPRTRVVTEAILNQFMKGSIPKDLLTQIKAEADKRPDANLYSLIASAMNGSSPRLLPKTKTYLKSRVDDLAGRSHMVAAGGKTVLQSLLRVLSILERDERHGGVSRGINQWTDEVKAWRARFDDLEKRYLGYTPK